MVRPLGSQATIDGTSTSAPRKTAAPEACCTHPETGGCEWWKDTEVIMSTGEYLRQLAHAMGNTAHIVHLAQQLLQYTEADSPGVADVNRMLQQHFPSMNALIHGVRRVGRALAGVEMRPRPCYACELVGLAIEAISAELANPTLSLGVEAEADLPPVLVDPELTAQAVEELLRNAVEHTGEGTIQVTLWRAGEFVGIRVEDSGCGLSAELLPRMFLPFVRGENAPIDLHAGRMGVGLTLVQRVMRQQGGTVLGTSPGRGQGSRFELLLPVSRNSSTGAFREPDDSV